MRNARAIALEILGSGEHVPQRRVWSEDFDRRWGKSAGWTRRHTGVASRAFTGPDESVLTMGAAAARQALEDGGLDGSTLDAIVAVGSVPAQAIPCTAAMLQRELGLADTGIPAFDVNATCLGFVVALDLVAQGIATGRFDRVLIVASEVASAGLNWNDTETAGLFGDGAGAVIVGATRNERAALLATHLQTYSAGAELCVVRAGGTLLHPRTKPAEEFLAGTYFEMRGRKTYRFAAEILPRFLETLCARAGIAAADIDAWVPHQASGLAISHLQSALGLRDEKFVLTLDTHGNQISASLPIALHRGRTQGRVGSGRLVALLGTGAGLSFGGAILRA
jgi:3-oxoacyl-[acyl-carrier-protein] synthase-3